VHLIGGSIPICEPSFPKKTKVPLLDKKEGYFRFCHLSNHVEDAFFPKTWKKLRFLGISVSYISIAPEEQPILESTFKSP